MNTYTRPWWYVIWILMKNKNKRMFWSKKNIWIARILHCCDLFEQRRMDSILSTVFRVIRGGDILPYLLSTLYWYFKNQFNQLFALRYFCSRGVRGESGDLSPQSSPFCAPFPPATPFFFDRYPSVVSSSNFFSRPILPIAMPNCQCHLPALLSRWKHVKCFALLNCLCMLVKLPLTTYCVACNSL